MDTSGLFRFSKSQRKGLLLLVGCIIGAQLLYHHLNFATENILDTHSPEIAMLQCQIDSAKQAASAERVPKLYPFNPNFITDYKGYTLGMSAEEIDRLHRFRSENQWINSAADFQAVTRVSDSLLQTLSPYFTFPDWVSNPRRNTSLSSTPKSFAQKRDLNQATAAELQEIRGIGETLSKRIIDYRTQLGGFLSDEQLQDVWGLEYAVVRAALEEFTVKESPGVTKISLNQASASDLSTLPYFSYQQAKEIVDYRLLHEGIHSFEELEKIKGFPYQKIDRIALYLSLE